MDDLLFVHLHHRFHKIPEERIRQVPDPGDPDPVGNGRLGIDGDRCSAFEGFSCRGAGRSLDADHPGVRGEGFDRHRYPCDQSSAPHWGDHGRDAGEICHDLEADRPLAGNHGFVIIGMDEGHLRRFGQGDRMSDALLEGCSVEDDMSPVSCGCLLLAGGDPDRHDDGGRDSCDPGCHGNPLGMVAGRSCDDACRPDRLPLREDPVGRSPDLEGAGLLHRLELEVHPGTGHLREGRGVDERGPDDPPGEEGGRLPDRCDGDHG
ncbi:MAG: hypothetical protein BWY93_02145 [Euryarchaeota archaeon ADurb.BinA087]|nr:MAG: hypothetical protein BWY93_02145 [Euryarchaeota archaeon ADurb.BinA087]